MNKNWMKLEFVSLSSNESFAKKVVAEFAVQLDPTMEELADIRTAVSEALDNAIVHAYPGELGIITVRCAILRDNVLDIIIKDKGVGIANVSRAMAPMFTTCPERSGMGFTIMEGFMTSCEVKSGRGKGTTVHMKKRITPKRSLIEVK